MRSLKSLLIGVALAALASPAAAQWYGGAYPYNAPPPPYGYGGPAYARPLPRDIIVERLEDRGFEDVGRPRFDGTVYVVEATSRRAGAVRLVVDAFDGHVIRQTRLTIARLDDEEFDLDGDFAPRGRSVSPPPEMPNAPGWRGGRPDPLPGRQAARPVEPQLDPPSPARRARPADPRLTPDSPAAARPAEPEPRREARRPAGAETGVPAGGVDGVNPDSKRAAKPAPSPKADAAAKPEKPPTPPAPAARTSPTAPAPTTAAKPAGPKPASGPATAEAGERKVRVIEGVTPMNSGQQASPAPQNNVEAAPKP